MKSYKTVSAKEGVQPARPRRDGTRKMGLDMHQRHQGELPKEDNKQTRDQSECGTTMEEGTKEMDLSKVDNENRYTLYPYKVGKDEYDTYNNIDFFKLGEDHSLIKNAAKKPGAGK